MNSSRWIQRKFFWKWSVSFIKKHQHSLMVLITQATIMKIFILQIHQLKRRAKSINLDVVKHIKDLKGCIFSLLVILVFKIFWNIFWLYMKNQEKSSSSNFRKCLVELLVLSILLSNEVSLQCRFVKSNMIH